MLLNNPGAELIKGDLLRVAAAFKGTEEPLAIREIMARSFGKGGAMDKLVAVLTVMHDAGMIHPVLTEYNYDRDIAYRPIKSHIYWQMLTVLFNMQAGIEATVKSIMPEMYQQHPHATVTMLRPPEWWFEMPGMNRQQALFIIPSKTSGEFEAIEEHAYAVAAELKERTGNDFSWSMFSWAGFELQVRENLHTYGFMREWSQHGHMLAGQELSRLIMLARQGGGGGAHQPVLPRTDEPSYDELLHTLLDRRSFDESMTKLPLDGMV